MTGMKRKELEMQYEDSLALYVDEGVPPSPFIRAVLENDLEAAVRLCPGSLELLRDVVEWLCEEAPQECFGSPKIVKEWLALMRERAEE